MRSGSFHSGKKEVEKMREITDEVKKVIIGKDEVVDMVFAAILAQGHVLMEDVPGVGITTLAVAVSKALGLDT